MALPLAPKSKKFEHEVELSPSESVFLSISEFLKLATKCRDRNEFRPTIQTSTMNHFALGTPS
jgi:hypothetical protein